MCFLIPAINIEQYVIRVLILCITTAKRQLITFTQKETDHPYIAGRLSEVVSSHDFENYTKTVNNSVLLVYLQSTESCLLLGTETHFPNHLFQYSQLSPRFNNNNNNNTLYLDTYTQSKNYVR